MSGLERFLEVAGEIRGRNVEAVEATLPLADLGLDSLAMTELLIAAEDLCDSALFDDLDEALTVSLVDLYERATHIAVTRDLDEPPWV